MKHKEKRSIGKYAILLFSLFFSLTACGDSTPKEKGLVSPEALKNYEHGVRQEKEPETDPNQGNDPSQTPTPPVVSDPTASATPVPVAPEEGYEETNDTVYVAVSKLNLRSGPSTDYDIVGKAVYGDSFTRVAKGNNGWDKLLFEGKVVYAFAEYLSTEKTTSKGTETEMGTLMADAKKN